MMSQGRFELREINGLPVVEVAGDVDLTNAAQFEAVLARAAAADRRAVVIVLGQAAYFDSKGVHALLRFGERMGRNRLRCVVVAPVGTIARRVLDIAAVGELCPIAESVEEALARAAESG